MFTNLNFQRKKGGEKDGNESRKWSSVGNQR